MQPVTPFIAFSIIYLLFLALVVSAQQVPVVPVPRLPQNQLPRPNVNNPVNRQARKNRKYGRNHFVRAPPNSGGIGTGAANTYAVPVKSNGDADMEVHPGRLFGWNPPRVDGGACSTCDRHTLEAQEFLVAHNWVRNQYKQPLFTWDEKLASFAREYAMKRYDDCKMVHSDGPYGENIFWGKRLHWTASDAVFQWYKERKWYYFNRNKCLSPAGKQCGHFTQIVWRDSVRVGCALQHCHTPGAGMLVICEYDPPGNYENENPLVDNNVKRANSRRT